MRLVQITEKKIDVTDATFGGKTLHSGKMYWTHDTLAQMIVKENWGRVIGDEKALPQLPREVLKQNNDPLKVLILFKGGLGDAISTAILFILLEKEHNLRIDVICHYDTWHCILVPIGFRGKRLDFPVDAEEINKYDYIQTDLTSFITDQTRRWDRCIMEELALAYRIDMPKFRGNYSIPDHIMRAMCLPEGKKVRIGVCFESKGKIRSYPDELGAALISGLIGLGFEVYRFGAQQSNSMNDLSSNGYHDYSGRTNIFELSALLKQMDLVLGMDSFPVHLSNILGVRTIALLSTTTPGIFRMHKNVFCIHSQIECAPCGEIMDKCPKGCNECKAFYHESISLERILARIIRECTSLFKNRFGTA